MEKTLTPQRILFIDRDGTIAVEPPVDLQLDSFEKLEFLPGVIGALSFIRQRLDYRFVMVSNQDGLGTESFPLDTFYPVQNFILDTLKGEGVTFDAIHIDPSFPEENLPTRKPGTAMLTEYMDNPKYDLKGSYVIGDRPTDVQLARNLGCKAILLSDDDHVLDGDPSLYEVVALQTCSWQKVAEFLFAGDRIFSLRRKTQETDITVRLNLDGSGKAKVSTGIGFFDHMLSQIAHHGGMDLCLTCKGDLDVDAHHTIEDTGLALGECLLKALGDKRGIERYGFFLPMDDCRASVCLDFGGRPWLVWNAEFHREKIGEMPTEMFFHFFKSLSDAARMNLFIEAEGTNEHHKIEGIFKAFSHSLKTAVRRDIFRFNLPSSKGVL